MLGELAEVKLKPRRTPLNEALSRLCVLQRQPLAGRGRGDSDFIADVCRLIEDQRADLVPVDRALLFEAFQTFGCRPRFRPYDVEALRFYRERTKATTPRAPPLPPPI